MSKNSPLVDAMRIISDAARDVDGSRCWKLYVLVDPTLGDPLSGRIQQNEKLAVVPINQELLSARHRPYLVELGDIGRDPAIDLTVECAIREVHRDPTVAAGARSICAWIVTSEPLLQLASVLARKASIRFQGSHRLFRFWDPRVMDLLHHFLNATEVKGLLHPVARWCWMNRASGVEVLELERSTVAQDKAYLSGGLQDLRPERFINYGYINSVLDLLSSTSSSAGVDLHILDQKISYGRDRWQLESEQDLVIYGLYSVLIGPQFDAHPLVLERMTLALTNRISPVHALEDFNEQFWSSIAV